MLLEQQANPPTTAPSLSGSEAGAEFWLQETALRGSRRAVIHMADCTISSARWNAPSGDKWYGPFAALNCVRDKSDGLSGIAIRAECRCVRRGLEGDLPRMALLNEPLFRKPKPPLPEPKRKPESAKTVARGEKKSHAQRQLSKCSKYAVLMLIIFLIVAGALFCVPLISVQKASAPGPSPFLLANKTYLPITNVAADCSVELQPAAVRLHSSHQTLADRLPSKGELAAPCFQSVGGTTPETSGMTMQVRLSYALFGIRHLTQTFTFVAARNQNGVCGWAEKSDL